MNDVLNRLEALERQIASIQTTLLHVATRDAVHEVRMEIYSREESTIKWTLIMLVGVVLAFGT